MSILRKSLQDILIADLEELTASAARETSELEFKGTLPFVPTKGQPAKSDRWIEKGDRVGDYARDEILAELVAFANADGGTLILGLHETKDEPRRAEELAPLPNCEGLARRLLDATEDIIEPRLPTVAVRALGASKDGDGFIIFRVGKSPVGPHRLTTTREFYLRRGERASKMTVREIKDYTLEAARFGDRLEAIFAERRRNAESQYMHLRKVAEGRPLGIPPLVIRVTAVPTTPQIIPDITRQHQLWWRGKGFRLKVDETEIECGYPLNRCGDQPKVRLRSLVADIDPKYDCIPRLLRADGTIEFQMCRHWQDPFHGSSGARFYMGWIVGLAVGVISQVNHLRKNLAWDAVEFGLEIEIWSEPHSAVFWTDRDYGGAVVKDEMPLVLPRYSVTSDASFNDLINLIVRDIFDACGAAWNQKCVVPWEALAN